MNDIDPGQEAKLKKLESDAETLRDLMRHPGMEIMREEIDRLTARCHSRWLLAEKDEAEKIREMSRGYEVFFSLIKRRIVEGDEAKRQLRG